ncbi:YceD family protein [Caulobacter sp. KR2-114]|uniref:YceD family protein n=1 Tax=Caulobacter sp. KR2-114 TaxID=3400912 RepID=UPI003C1194B4
MRPPPPRWSRLVSWRDIPLELRLEADEATRKALARDLGLEALGSLTADLALKPWLDGAEMTGRLRATVTQISGVSLEPFDSMIDEPLLIRFVPAGSPHAPPPPEDEVEVDLDADDPPDVVDGDAIDVAHYVVEQLSLAIDPFARKPGEVFEPPPDESPSSPFAALAALRAAKDEDKA